MPEKSPKEVKTSAEWLKHPMFYKLQVLNPEGWDQSNHHFSFNEEEISLESFVLRCRGSVLAAPIETQLLLTRMIEDATILQMKREKKPVTIGSNSCRTLMIL